MTRWVETILLGDVWHAYGEGEMSFGDARDEVVLRLRQSRWAGAYQERATWTYPRGDVNEQVQWLELQDDIEGFDFEWAKLLDLADRDCVWLDTHRRKDEPGVNLRRSMAGKTNERAVTTDEILERHGLKLLNMHGPDDEGNVHPNCTDCASQ